MFVSFNTKFQKPIYKHKLVPKTRFDEYLRTRRMMRNSIVPGPDSFYRCISDAVYYTQVRHEEVRHEVAEFIETSYKASKNIEAFRAKLFEIRHGAAAPPQLVPFVAQLYKRTVVCFLFDSRQLTLTLYPPYKPPMVRYAPDEVTGSTIVIACDVRNGQYDQVWSMHYVQQLAVAQSE